MRPIRARPGAMYGRGAVRPADRVDDDRLENAPVRRRLLVHAPARRHGPQGRWQRLNKTRRRHMIHRMAAELYVPAGVPMPPLPAFPSPPPPVFPSPTPVPTPLPPAAGPVPPNARTWKVTVDNKSSEPATLVVAEDGRSARRVCDSERGPSRRHREGDLPLPCRWGMDLREPATGRRRRVGQTRTRSASRARS